jgi:hypothetical protein
MPRKNTKLAMAKSHTAEAKRIVAQQRDLIARLKALGQPVLEAEVTLQTYLSALKHLEEHERKVRTAIIKHETKKPPSS